MYIQSFLFIYIFENYNVKRLRDAGKFRFFLMPRIAKKLSHANSTVLSQLIRNATTTP